MNILEEVIYPAIDEINSDKENDIRLQKAKTAELIGPNTVLDSIGLVNFIMIVEEKIQEKTGRSITLASDKAMSRKSSPFRTLASLEEYIGESLEVAK